MIEITKYYIDSLKLISENKQVPYYLDTKVRNCCKFLGVSDKSEILHFIIANNNAKKCFKYLEKNEALRYICLYLYNLISVKQDKRKTKNAFEHTLRVLEEVPIDDIDLRWCALLHDLGKYDSWLMHGDFRNHALYSFQIAKYFCYAYRVANEDKICSIVKNHMYPLDYQREPNWTEKAIRKFINRCSKEYVIPTIEFSYYDKKSENNVKEYLDIILDLRNKTHIILRDFKERNIYALEKKI